MENQKHTPEPWKKQGLTIWSANSVGLEVVANTTTANGDEKDAANARRIVACVNACTGLSTDALEAAFQEGVLLDFTRPVAVEGEETARLKAEKERLRNALKGLLR